jgi:alpha-D-ribose 1-methylphosphonate 5-triphosphate diphosphatase
MAAILLTNARVVLPDETRSGLSVLVEDGVIAALDPGHSRAARVIDLAGRLLLPGLVDLHCDALEKEVEPRPNVHFPLDFACAQADRRNAAAGITTVYHALSFANHELGVRNNAFAAELARALGAWNRHALVDNRVHARYEISDASAPPYLAGLLDRGDAHMISFMDHTPGQGQFKDVAAFRTYLARTYQRSEAELDGILASKRDAAAAGAARIGELAALARSLGVPIASHDDDTPAKVASVAAMGAAISEFPINLETARAAKASGLATLFGAPNLLRGQSQSGSMRALDAVLDGVADCLCGDYSPAALLPAAMRLPELAGIALHEAVALVSAHPARAAGLRDRGRIAPGLRADLVAVRCFGALPLAEQVWCAGRAVLSTRSSDE